ncbi:MAG: cell division ATP-binding protein FtsE [Armatimonadetes bacterium]|nr:cell division ATP-binding protein FtsE [Armatimonadota bacterium]
MVYLNGVTVIYPNGTRALHDVTLHVERGEFVSIVGASGSGKSTLLQVIYREVKPTSGQVIVGSQDVTALRSSLIPYLRRRVGVVFQDFRLLPDRTVWENVGFALDVLGASKREKYRKVPVALELVGLAHKSDCYPHEVSAGEQQRVCIARALVNGPQVLLADEPTGNLDPDTSWEIVQILTEIADRGTTVIMATHDKAIVDRLRRRVASLLHGTLVRDDRAGGGYDEP